MANIGHKEGGRVVAITGIGHSTFRGRAGWCFFGRCEWSDGSHKREPLHEYEIHPAQLCLPEDGNSSDLDSAVLALNDYLRANGQWIDGQWVPQEPTGRWAYTL